MNQHDEATFYIFLINIWIYLYLLRCIYALEFFSVTFTILIFDFSEGPKILKRPLWQMEVICYHGDRRAVIMWRFVEGLIAVVEEREEITGVDGFIERIIARIKNYLWILSAIFFSLPV